MIWICVVNCSFCMYFSNLPQNWLSLTCLQPPQLRSSLCIGLKQSFDFISWVFGVCKPQNISKNFSITYRWKDCNVSWPKIHRHLKHLEFPGKEKLIWESGTRSSQSGNESYEFNGDGMVEIARPAHEIMSLTDYKNTRAPPMSWNESQYFNMLCSLCPLIGLTWCRLSQRLKLNLTVGLKMSIFDTSVCLECGLSSIFYSREM